MLNTTVFINVRNAHKKILIVTKYWNTQKTHDILREAEEKYSDVFIALWENRIESIQEKNITRNKVHFIGNIQSQKIPEIVKYCCVIHSLTSLKHAIKIDTQWFAISAFVQIHLDTNKQQWISAENLAYFLQACKDFKNLKIIWISGMWSADISKSEKRDEFQKLIALRNTHMPEWLISAGTSQDYEEAMSEWIDMVRVGKKTLNETE
jgi:uncharacterized pyridoxal phosphate-containing UPF0001 family protein